MNWDGVWALGKLLSSTLWEVHANDAFVVYHFSARNQVGNVRLRRLRRACYSMCYDKMYYRLVGDSYTQIDYGTNIGTGCKQ